MEFSHDDVLLIVKLSCVSGFEQHGLFFLVTVMTMMTVMTVMTVMTGMTVMTMMIMMTVMTVMTVVLVVVLVGVMVLVVMFLLVVADFIVLCSDGALLLPRSPHHRSRPCPLHPKQFWYCR